MAKRSYSRKSKKLQPAVQNLFFAFPSWDGVSTLSSQRYIDLSQVASLVNRRFYRQGVQWAVNKISIHFPELSVGETIASRPSISLSKLPNTWVMSNAWTKGFKTWQRMNNKALEESESVRPKFLDFKIYADQEHCNLGYAANLLPLSNGGAFTAGEWIPSKYVVPNTASPGNVQNFEVKAVGANYGAGSASGLAAVSLIEGYAASRGLPNIEDPNTPDDASDASGSTPENWMSALFNEGTTQDDQVITDMITENNEAPYPFENDGTHTDTMYPGGANQGTGLEVHDYKQFTSTTVSNTITLDGGVFPCGLMKFTNPIRYAAADGSTIIKDAILHIQLVPGEHRGYLCEPMTEM